MSSTDERRAARVFEECLLPAARKLRERGVRFFPLGPDSDEESWYTAAPTRPNFAELEPSQCEAALRELWESQGLAELAELAEPLMRLSAELEMAEEEIPDISPFVYVMY